MTVRALMTRGLSTVRAAIDLIHQAMGPEEFHLGASYSTEHTPLRLSADAFFLEPPEATPEAYVAWLLALCRDRDFRLVWPQSRWSSLLDARARFADAGVRLILPCPDSATLAEIQDKARANARLAAAGVPLPQARLVTARAEFDEAVRALSDGGRRACVKPVKSIYGLGFRLIDNGKSPLERFLGNDCFTVGESEFAQLLDSAEGQTPFLTMEYLGGDERSIDCLAHEGQLVRAIVRRKPASSRWRWQIVEDDPEAWDIARRAVAAFRLHGLINVQTRERIAPDGRRQQCFLEVNPRMSGGLYLSCLAGLNLPYWMLRLMCGTVDAEAIPRPASGVQVAKIEQGVIL
ncbi:MAG: ATP-grasp domain-containing protein [Candidatus Competibacteraceae bacterium]|nr:ATP-grasp domain-containing protein [Candidatus Competibacteraceae bacterium]